MLEAVGQLSPSNLEARGSSCESILCENGHKLSSLPDQATVVQYRLKKLNKNKKYNCTCIIQSCASIYEIPHAMHGYYYHDWQFYCYYSCTYSRKC